MAGTTLEGAGRSAEFLLGWHLDSIEKLGW